ncbi:DUF1456 family protein [Agaribacter marinus]|uniref:DUF1456 family protein n=1 Tax=Agaribacter marinus TaxID=1431249 RepID=A0AA37T0R2_9ALTE|nr:DUF1456 family protein [Agaribacter marinus]GLR71814.1 hypothetical protein GCM10007852_27220 [Agaribacter marinus]
MINNDVLRRVRFALRINDGNAIDIFKLVDYDMDKDYLQSIMKKDEEAGFLPCRDKTLAMFLDGLVIQRRGKKEGALPNKLKAGEKLSNNDILRKLRIAMSYRDEDMIEILRYANFRIGKTELSALFRKADHRNYKDAGDQIVRNLLQGMVRKYRPEAAKDSTSKKTYSKLQSLPAENNKPTNKQAPRMHYSQKTEKQVAPNTPVNHDIWGKPKPKK